MLNNSRTTSKLVLTLIIFSLFLIMFSSNIAAQIGEVAGPLSFNVQVGHQQTLPLTVINIGDTPINFSVYVPTPKLVANEITPKIIAIPQNGTISPHSQFVINVTVFMPTANKPGSSGWSGIISVQEVSNLSNPSGAVVEAGVGKLFTIGAVASTTTTSVYIKNANYNFPQPSSLSVIELAAGVLVIIAAVAYTISKGRKLAKKSKQKEVDKEKELRDKIRAEVMKELSQKKGKKGITKKTPRAAKRTSKPKSKSTTKRRRSR